MARSLILLIFVPLSFMLVLPQLTIAALLYFLGRHLKIADLERLGFNWAYSLDQLGNTLWLGDPDETISSRTGRALKSGKPRWWVPWFGKLVDGLAWFFAKDENHVRKSVEDDQMFEKEIDSWID